MSKDTQLNRRQWLSAAAGAGALASAPALRAQASKVQLSMCLSDNDRTRPLREGRVKADALDLVVSTAHPSEMFWRELHFSEFDVSEMSCSSLLMAIAHGDKRFVAIPVGAENGSRRRPLRVRIQGKPQGSGRNHAVLIRTGADAE